MLEATAVHGPGDPRHLARAEVDRVAEVHFHLRFRLERALNDLAISAEAQSFTAGFGNYGDYWRASYADRFFDMRTFQRLGSGVETGLRRYHAEVAGREAASRALRQSRGIFQALVRPERLLRLFQEDCRISLEEIPTWPDLREIMVHRHLFAHRSGLVDEKYVEDLKFVIGRDLLSDLELRGFPDEEVYWFEPLRRLPYFIEAVHTFAAHLPERT